MLPPILIMSRKVPAAVNWRECQWVACRFPLQPSVEILLFIGIADPWAPKTVVRMNGPSGVVPTLLTLDKSAVR